MTRKTMHEFSSSLVLLGKFVLFVYEIQKNFQPLYTTARDDVFFFCIVTFLLAYTSI